MIGKLLVMVHSQQQMAAAIKSIKEAMFTENQSNFDFCVAMHSMFPTSGEMCHMCYSCKIPNIFSVVLLCFMLQHLSIWKAQVSMTCGWVRVLKIMDHVMLYKISPSLLSLFSRSYTI